MKKNLIFILALSIILYMSSTSVYAEDVLSQESSNIIEPRQLYEYAWEITSKTANPITYGAWRDGPTGKGPSTLDINESTTIFREYTNTISGEYTMGKRQLH